MLLENPLAGIETIRFRIVQTLWQLIVFDAKSPTTVESPGHDAGTLSRLHQFEETRMPPRNGVQAPDHKIQGYYSPRCIPKHAQSQGTLHLPQGIQQRVGSDLFGPNVVGCMGS